MKTLTLDEWIGMGVERFGLARAEWRFKCPACAHTQTAIDFRPYRGLGADLRTAYMRCVGNYNGVAENPALPGCTCDVLQMLPGDVPVLITTPGGTIKVFDFDET